MRFEIDNIGLVDGDKVFGEIQKWIEELSNNIIDNIILETLDTVVDILIENMVTE